VPTVFGGVSFMVGRGCPPYETHSSFFLYRPIERAKGAGSNSSPRKSIKHVEVADNVSEVLQ
jgi:hypothetical protein